MAHIFEVACKSPLPATALRYDNTGIRQLVALCREMQVRAGQAPFFLACRTAGKLLGVDYTTASRWLFLLREEEVLQVVEPGNRTTKKATRFRYLGD